jgi:hypothetical protein
VPRHVGSHRTALWKEQRDRRLAGLQTTRQGRCCHGSPALYTVYRCSKNIPKAAISAIFREFGAASGGNSSLGKVCRIMRSDMIPARRSWAGHPRTEWVEVHRNCHTDYRGLFTIPALSAESQVACPGVDLAVTRDCCFWTMPVFLWFPATRGELHGFSSVQERIRDPALVGELGNLAEALFPPSLGSA